MSHSSRRKTSNSRGPGQEGTVQVRPRSGIDWSKQRPMCPHGLHAGCCEPCNEYFCDHPGAAKHVCRPKEANADG